jgi:malonyl CoA-acyl carrier protein transacylase
MMLIAGVAVSESDVRELIVLLRRAGLEAVATKLDRDAEVEAHMFNLTTVDREAILRVLDDPPTDALAGLRSVLLGDHESFQREGLV